MKQPLMTDVRDDPSPLLVPTSQMSPPVDELETPAPPSSSLDDIFSPAPGEHSDVSRLRSQHVTAGYRDGIASSKGLHVQAGFDEGYPLGAALGYLSARLIGTLEGLVAMGATGPQEMLQTARKELALDGLVSREWFDEDGVWTFEVDGEGWEDVAEAHPVIRIWEERVREAVTNCGMKVAWAGASEKVEERSETQSKG